jgi:hypothetical protein
MMSNEGKLCDEYPINNGIMKSMVIGINIVWKYVYLITQPGWGASSFSRWGRKTFLGEVNFLREGKSHAILAEPSSERVCLIGAQVWTTMGWPLWWLGL